MFEHLDDPNPPPPRQLLVELVVAEGGRRRRRRAVVAGGMAATLLVLAGGVRLAQMAGTDPDVDIGPQNSSSDSHREGGESDDDLSLEPGPSDPVTTPSNSETSSGEAPAPLGATTFAALTDDGRVVLADIDQDGAVIRPLVTAADHDMQLGNQVALSPDRQTVYFDATPGTGDEAGESAIYKVGTSGNDEPEFIDTGASPAISPAEDAPRFAYVKNSAHIVVHDLHGDGAQTFRGTESDESSVQDLSFTSDGQGLVFTAAPPDGPASLYYLDLSTFAAIASINDAAELGPGEAAPAGTGWSSPDVRATDRKIVVISTCCAPSIAGEPSFAAADPNSAQQPTSEAIEGVSGIVLQASYDSSGQNQLVLTVEDDESTSLYLRQDGPLQRLDRAEQYTAIGW